MKRLLVSSLKYIIGFGIGALLIWWSLHSLSGKDLTDIKEALLRARFWLLIPVFIILLSSHWFRAMRWKQLITPLGYNPPILQLICGLLIGYIGNQMIPRAGEILRCTSVAKANKIPAEKLIGTMVAERAFDVVCLGLITFGTIIMEYAYIESYANDIFASIRNGIEHGGNKRWVIIGILLLIIVGFIVLVRKLPHTKFGQFIRRILKGIWEGLSSIRKVKNKPFFLLNTLMMWICYVLATWVGCFALEETMHLTISTSVAMLVFGTFGIIIAPGGLGAYPIAIQKTLNLYGINDTIGLAAGWILWIAQFIFTIIFGTLAYILIYRIKPVSHEEHVVRTT